MSEGGQKKRKSKGWYRKQAYHNKRARTEERPRHRLEPGLKGFIVTCNERERDAVKETYNILTEYADKLYGPEVLEKQDSSGESEGEDIEAAIAKEVQTLKEASTSGERRFQNSRSGAKNCIFIKTSIDDPVELAVAIFSDLLESKQQKSRNALRLLPVVGTCKAAVKDINELAKTVLQPYFTETKLEVTFTVTFKARNNGGIGRDMTVSTMRQTIMDMFPGILLRFTHANPQITVLVEVICGVACIAVAKNFALYRKYNLVEVVHDKPSNSSHSSVQGEGTPAALGTDNSGVDKPVDATQSVCSVQGEGTPAALATDNGGVDKPVGATQSSSSAQGEGTAVLATDNNGVDKSVDATQSVGSVQDEGTPAVLVTDNSGVDNPVDATQSSSCVQAEVSPAVLSTGNNDGIKPVDATQSASSAETEEVTPAVLSPASGDVDKHVNSTQGSSSENPQPAPEKESISVVQSTDVNTSNVHSTDTDGVEKDPKSLVESSDGNTVDAQNNQQD